MTVVCVPLLLSRLAPHATASSRALDPPAGGAPEPAPCRGARAASRRRLLRGGAIERVAFDPARATVELVAGGRCCVFEEVRATTLLAPRDGTPGTVEWLRVVAADAETLALELRVQWRDVPRVYRMVCGAVRIARAAPPDGAVRGRALRRATRSTTAARAARPSAARR